MKTIDVREFQLVSGEDTLSLDVLLPIDASPFSVWIDRSNVLHISYTTSIDDPHDDQFVTWHFADRSPAATPDGPMSQLRPVFLKDERDAFCHARFLWTELPHPPRPLN